MARRPGQSDAPVAQPVTEWRPMPIPRSSDNTWQPSSSGDDPQGSVFDDWLRHHVPDIVQDLPERVEFAQLRELADRVASEHPGMMLCVELGELDDPDSAGAYRDGSMTIVLPSAVEDLKAAMSMGTTSVCSEHFELFDRVMFLALASHALVQSTYGQGDLHIIELHGPEYVGAFAYLVGRYADPNASRSAWETLEAYAEGQALDATELDQRTLTLAIEAGFRLNSREGALLESALRAGLRVRAFDRQEWRLPEPE